MKAVLITMSIVLISTSVFSKERVSGYIRADGTRVSSYERSSRDSTRSNNYGRPSSRKNRQEVDYPKTRDQDRDGIPNIRDLDDNNNGISDDNERNY